MSLVRLCFLLVPGHPLHNDAEDPQTDTEEPAIKRQQTFMLEVVGKLMKSGHHIRSATSVFLLAPTRASWFN